MFQIQGPAQDKIHSNQTRGKKRKKKKRIEREEKKAVNTEKENNTRPQHLMTAIITSKHTNLKIHGGRWKTPFSVGFIIQEPKRRRVNDEEEEKKAEAK